MNLFHASAKSSQLWALVYNMTALANCSWFIYPAGHADEPVWGSLHGFYRGIIVRMTRIVD